MGRLVLLQTSPRVAPGLLTAQAWDVLRTADAVLCRSGGSSQGQALAVAGVGVGVEETTEPLSALLRAAAGGTAVWLAEDDDGLAEALAAEVVDRGERGDRSLDVEVLAGSFDLPGSRLLDLVEVMDRLRAECPWDREQTHRSLVRYLVEEAYETVEAIENGDRDHLREELGDLLLQVMFHSRIAAEDEDDPWTVDEVAAGIVEKLVRRHPHVFADLDVAGVHEVESNWETIKTAEKQRASVLEGVPLAMPALSLAEKVLGRAERVGAGSRDFGEMPAAGVGGVGEEGGRVRGAGSGAGAADDGAAHGADEGADHGTDDGAELGARLLALVAVARRRDVDPEQALRDAVRRLSAEVQAAEVQAAEDQATEGRRPG